MKNFFSSALERVGNQFVVSLVISWLIWNWPLAILFLKYNSEEVHKFFGCSFSEFLIFNSNGIGYTLVYPLLSAFFWIVLKQGIDIFVSWIEQKKNKQIVLNQYTEDKSSFLPYLLHFEVLDRKNKEIEEFKSAFTIYKQTETQNLDLSHKVEYLSNEKVKLQTEKKELIISFNSLINSQSNYVNEVEEVFDFLFNSIDYDSSSGEIIQNDIRRYIQSWKKKDNIIAAVKELSVSKNKYGL